MVGFAQLLGGEEGERVVRKKCRLHGALRLHRGTAAFAFALDILLPITHFSAVVGLTDRVS